ncbi:MAG TPA: hypothetical protein VKU88_04825 [Acidimicrobiales bacterium]|nr:hypothetical protein [Acidimicrobiales bacterium]
MRTLAEIVPLRTAACREAVDAVAEMAAGEDDVEPRAAAHVRSCLRCQAEVAAFRRVLKVMRSMRHDLVVPPASSLAAVLKALDEAALDGSAGSWALWAYLGGLTAAGAAGMIVWLTLRRPGWSQAG